MATYILQYTNHQGTAVTIEIEAYSDQAAYNQAASKLWNVREAIPQRPSLTCTDGRVIQSADDIWF